MDSILGEVVLLASDVPVARDNAMWKNLSSLNPSIVRPLTVEAQMSAGSAFSDPKETTFDVSDARLTLCRESVIKHIQSNGVDPIHKFVASRFNGVAVKIGEDIRVFRESIPDSMVDDKTEEVSTASAGSSASDVILIKAEGRINVHQSPWSNQFQSIIPIDAPLTQETLKRLQSESRALFSTRDLTLFSSHRKMNDFGDRIEGTMALEKTLNVLLAEYASQYFPTTVTTVSSAHITTSSASAGTDMVVHTVATTTSTPDDPAQQRKSWVAFHYVTVAQVESVLKVVVFTRVKLAHSEPHPSLGGTPSTEEDEFAVLGNMHDSKVSLSTQYTKEQIVVGTLEDQLTHNTSLVANLVCTMIEQSESTGIMPALDNIGAANVIRHAEMLRGGGDIYDCSSRKGPTEETSNITVSGVVRVGVDAIELAEVFKNNKR